MLVDVSGSMYRFNGHDYRLQREMEVVCMVMEAFQGYEDKLKVNCFYLLYELLVYLLEMSDLFYWVYATIGDCAGVLLVSR